MDIVVTDKYIGKIIFYNLDGTVNHSDDLSRSALIHINGMKTRVHLKDGSCEIGYSSILGKNDCFDLWTWVNLDESTGKIINNSFEQKFRPIRIDDILFVEAILYSNPRWGTRLSNDFLFTKKDADC